MTPNPLLGVIFHWIGGFASASFYVPYKGVRRWSWEVLWIVGGVFSWILAPWLFASLRTHDLIAVLSSTPGKTIFWCWLFGALWGFGGLTFGLAVRYLGIAMGTAMALGLCAAFGTLIPPIVDGTFAANVLGTGGGRIILLGVFVCLLGIVVVGLAGHAKEKELPPAEVVEGAPTAVSFRKGVAVAIFAGIMSSCFAYGLAAGKPIEALTVAHGTDILAQGLPSLIVVLAGGFTTNFLWCLYLITKNKSGRQFLGAAAPDTASGARLGGGHEGRAPLLRNYVLCALAGTCWYFQFFFYTMGESQMGRYGFSSWTLHMASIIIFASLWGLGLHEWRGSSRRTKGVLSLGLLILIGSTVIIGAGNAMAKG